MLGKISLLSSISLITNLTLTGKIMNRYSNHPVFVGVKHDLHSSLSFRNFRYLNNYSPLLKGNFNNLLFSNVVFEKSVKPLEIKREFEFYEEKIQESDAKITLESCSFIECINKNQTHHGGALEVRNSTVTINDTCFELCQSNYAGGVYFFNSTVTIQNSNFSHNCGLNAAGAGEFENCKLVIKGGISHGNYATDSKGCFYIISSKGVIDQHHLILNHADGSCGGIYTQDCSLELKSMYFVHNHGIYGSGALEIMFPQRNFIIDNCTFISNEIFEDSINILIEGEGLIKIKNSVFDSPMNEVLEKGFGNINISSINNTINIDPKNPFRQFIKTEAEVEELSLRFDMFETLFFPIVLISILILIPSAICILHFTK